jgi:hypothetical protein
VAVAVAVAVYWLGNAVNETTSVTTGLGIGVGVNFAESASVFCW